MENTDGITPNVNPLTDEYRFSFIGADALWTSIYARTMTGRTWMHADEVAYDPTTAAPGLSSVCAESAHDLCPISSPNPMYHILVTCKCLCHGNR